MASATSEATRLQSFIFRLADSPRFPEFREFHLLDSLRLRMTKVTHAVTMGVKDLRNGMAAMPMSRYCAFPVFKHLFLVSLSL